MYSPGTLFYISIHCKYYVFAFADTGYKTGSLVMNSFLIWKSWIPYKKLLLRFDNCTCNKCVNEYEVLLWCFYVIKHFCYGNNSLPYFSFKFSLPIYMLFFFLPSTNIGSIKCFLMNKIKVEIFCLKGSIDYVILAWSM